jgi:transcriptional regulator with XRE-family HTH domain
MSYTFPMRRSPLLHPLAVLRTTVGLSQQEMGDLVNRAARTIQSIELLKMPLTAELALRIAEATGVDEAWLVEGNPNIPPRKGLTLIQAGKGEGEYTKADYEYYRAYLETAIWSEEKWAATLKKAEAKGDKAKVLELGLRKVEAFSNQKEIIQLIDDFLRNELQLILIHTTRTNDMRLVRWKIRRFLEDLVKEFSIKIPESRISTETLKLAIPIPKSAADVFEVAASKAAKQLEEEKRLHPARRKKH